MSLSRRVSGHLALVSRIHEKGFERSFGGLSPLVAQVNERKKGRNSMNGGGDQMDGGVEDSSYDLDLDYSYPMATRSEGMHNVTCSKVTLYATSRMILPPF